jgi:hypothetical protein
VLSLNQYSQVLILGSSCQIRVGFVQAVHGILKLMGLGIKGRNRWVVPVAGYRH